ncbi:MAG: ABC transporter substrate-binding protein, partial [Candidatus Thorarchaeota archaeon]
MIAVSRDLGWMMLILLLPMSFVSLPNYSPENQFVWESDSDPASFDPHTDLSSYDARILYNIYETLYTYPWNKNEAEPLLPLLAAEPPSITADGRNYTVRLRQEIKFHDNTPFNASCVKWNIERAMKIFHLNGSISLLAEALRDGWQMQEAAAINGTSSDTFKAAFDNWVENSSSIEAINTYEVRFILEDAYTPFIHLLAHPLLSMMSPTYVLSNSNDDRGPMGSHWGVEYGEVHTYMETYTCGTGPYMLTEWRQNEFIRLDLFEDYWRSFAAEPFITPPAYAGSIEKIWYKTNSDKTGRLVNLRTGLADVVDWPTANALEVWDNVTLSSKA